MFIFAFSHFVTVLTGRSVVAGRSWICLVVEGLLRGNWGIVGVWLGVTG